MDILKTQRSRKQCRLWCDDLCLNFAKQEFLGLMVLEPCSQRNWTRSSHRNCKHPPFWTESLKGLCFSLALLLGTLRTHCGGEHANAFLSSFAQEKSMLGFIHSNSYTLSALWTCHILCPFSSCSLNICLSQIWTQEALLVLIVSFPQSGSLCQSKPHRAAGSLNAALHWKH